METDPIALVDLDGTLCDYDRAMVSAMNRLHSPEEQEYDIWSNQPHIKARRDVISRQVGWWLGLPKLQLGFDILDELKHLNFQIHILTKGPSTKPYAWTEKVQWVDKHLKDYDVQVTITADKGLIYGAVLCDDYPEYVERWLEWRPRGTVIMPLRPGANDDYEHPNVTIYDGTNIVEVREKLREARER